MPSKNDDLMQQTCRACVEHHGAPGISLSFDILAGYGSVAPATSVVQAPVKGA